MMRKLLIIAVLISAINFNSQAQTQPDDAPKWGFSVGPELVIPNRSIFNIGYGASAKAEIPVAGNFAATLTGAYEVLSYKSLPGLTGNQPNATFIPLKAGVRYWAGTGAGLELELGDVLETRENNFGTKRNLFAFSLGPCFLIKLSDKQSIDLGIRYEQWSQGVVQQTTLRVAYRTGW